MENFTVDGKEKGFSGGDSNTKLERHDLCCEVFTKMAANTSSILVHIFHTYQEAKPMIPLSELGLAL